MEFSKVNIQQQLFQVSAKLYQLLESMPSGEKRDEFLQQMKQLLNERGELIEQLVQENIQLDETDPNDFTLLELDRGIQERLDEMMQSLKMDLRNLQTAKKQEQRYMNPYANVRVMDGMYYDKKK